MLHSSPGNQTEADHILAEHLPRPGSLSHSCSQAPPPAQEACLGLCFQAAEPKPGINEGETGGLFLQWKIQKRPILYQSSIRDHPPYSLCFCPGYFPMSFLLPIWSSLFHYQTRLPWLHIEPGYVIWAETKAPHPLSHNWFRGWCLPTARPILFSLPLLCQRPWEKRLPGAWVTKLGKC